MYRKILLAYDGSTDGDEALVQVESLVASKNTTVHLLAIIDPSENMLIVEGMAFVPDNRRHLTQKRLDAADQIDLIAKEMSADLVVLGHRDQGTLARWLNGSVGESILHHPPCSLLVAVKSRKFKNNVTPIREDVGAA